MHAKASEITGSFRDAATSLDFYWPGTGTAEVCERFGLEPHQVIKMASNENAYGSSPNALAAAAAALDKAFVYPTTRHDYARLRTAFADYASVDPDMIVPGPGADAVMRYVAHLFVNPGDEVVASPQCYDGHRWVSQLMGGVVSPVTLVDYHYDVDAVVAAVTDRTRIVWVCNPGNPTGTILSAAEVRHLVESVPPTVAIVFDQAYHEYVDDPRYGDALQLLREGHRNVIVLRTLSKAFGLAGMRVGYGIADPAVAEVVERTRETFHISITAVEAGIAATRDDLVWFRDTRERIVAERSRVQDALAGMGLGVVPSQTNFVLVDTGQEAVGVYERLMRRGIIVRLGSIWTYDTCVRITVGREEQNDRMLEAMAEALRD